MKVSKWVDFGAEVDVEIDLNDVRSAIAEACANVTDERFEEKPTVHDVHRALSCIGTFLKALTDEQIAMMTQPARDLCANFLAEHAERFKSGGLFKVGAGGAGRGGEGK